MIDRPVAWEKYNAHHWKSDYRDFVEFFMGRVFVEGHSTKQYEGAVELGAGDRPGDVGCDRGLEDCTPLAIGRLAKRTRCPVLVIHGSGGALRSHAQGAALAKRTGGAWSRSRLGHFRTPATPCGSTC